MTKAQKTIAFSSSLIFAVAVFLFFRFLYSYHIHYQEQFQLFEFTGAYFADVVSVPGGLADYLGRFLTQFCFSALWGSVVMAFVLAALQLVSFLAVGRRTLLFYALSFVPSAFVWAFLCDENALAGAAVALILCILAGWCFSGRAGSKAVLALKCVMVPVAYFLCGPIAMVYVFLAFRKERWWMLLSALLLLVLSPVVAEMLTQYPLSRLARGVHYYRYYNFNPYLLWAALLSLILIVCVSGLRFLSNKRFSGTAAGITALLIVLGSATLLVRSRADMDKEEIMKYDFLSSNRMWNRMMMCADVKNPSQPISVACLNMALSQSGRMADHMFDYFQNGPQGLLPDFVKETTSAMATAEFYYHLGMINTAQRFTFEAEESIPDFQKSARCYRMLVRTNIINGDYEVALKYIEALKHTLFHASWAREAEDLIYGGDAAVDADPEYGRMRALRFRSRDFLFSDREMDSMLGLLYLENKDNRTAFEYLLSWSLLKKDISRFKECLGLVSYPILPEVYQEALLLDWAQNNAGGGVPSFIEPHIASVFNRFISDVRADKPKEYMEKKYGSTYWYYYFYRYNDYPV